MSILQQMCGLNGERIETPAAAIGWRVRRLEKSGPPKLVYAREGGGPMLLPIDADLDVLRHEVQLEGKYRLDPVDDDGRVIANAPAGYVYLPSEHTHAEPPTASVPRIGNDTIVEAMRMNTELARTIIDRFPLIVESVAGLVRSAGDIGLPARAMFGLAAAGEDHNDENVDDDSASPSKSSGWMTLLESFAPQLMTAVVAAVANGKIKLPSGLGALLDPRRAGHAEEAAQIVEVASVRPAPGSNDPAPARGGRARTTTSMAHASSVNASAANVARDRAPSPSDAITNPALPTDLPTLDPKALAHFHAIQAGLTQHEQMMARALAAKLAPSELRAWFAELSSLGVPEAIAEIRAVLGTDATTTEPTGPTSKEAS